MKRILCLSLLALLLLPAAGEAQRRTTVTWGRQNPFSFTPYVGAFKDAYDLEADDSDLGWMIGFRAGYQEGQRTRLHLNLGYATSNDVATRPFPDSGVRDNQWVMLTAGGDFALVPGTTSIAVGADAGVAWRQVSSEDDIVVGTGDDGWGTYELVAPSLTLRHHFSQRTSLALTLQDYIFNVLEGDVEHSPALALGLSFR